MPGSISDEAATESLLSTPSQLSLQNYSRILGCIKTSVIPEVRRHQSSRRAEQLTQPFTTRVDGTVAALDGLLGEDEWAKV